MTMQNLQDPGTAESRIVPKWLFPPRFSDKDRFTSCRPEFMLVTHILQKHKNKKTNVGGWILRSGRGQMGETGSTSAALPATSRSTFPRHHQPKDLSILQRYIHLIDIKYCEDTRPQNQPSAAQEQHKGICSVLQGTSVTLQTIPFGWVAQSTIITHRGR